MRERKAAKEISVVILAIAIGTALNIICVASMYDAMFSHDPGLSENATQILTGAFGGIIGIIGSYLGYSQGIDKNRSDDIERTKTQEAPSQAPPDLTDHQGTPAE